MSTIEELKSIALEIIGILAEPTDSKIRANSGVVIHDHETQTTAVHERIYGYQLRL